MTNTGATRLIGAALAAFYLGVAALKFHSGEAHTLLWLCHTALALAAIALLLGRDALARAVLICMIVPTLVWWLDAGALVWTGRLLIGAIDPPETKLQALATSHHLFLAPLLIAILPRRTPDRSEILLAASIYALLILSAYFAAPPGANVNWSHAVLPGVDHPMVHAWNARAPIVRVPLTILGAFALFVAPGVVALRALPQCKPSPVTPHRRAATR